MTNDIAMDTDQYVHPENTTTSHSIGSEITNIYSNTGFDMLQILSRLVNRPNPKIQLGPIDFSCSFVVSDASRLDTPVIYCSPAFEALTGYRNNEIVGKNCRFLQSPNGQVECGEIRKHTDNHAVYHLKHQLTSGKEHQASIINYRKGGQAFVNLVTVIPLYGDNYEIEFFVGLQVDLVEQPNAILEKMKNGTYMINYHLTPTLKNTVSNTLSLINSMSIDEYFQEYPVTDDNNGLNSETLKFLFDSFDIPNTTKTTQQLQDKWNEFVLDHCSDFVFILSLKGMFLYVSNSSQTEIEYKPEELLGKNLSSICHPSDIVSVMREIKKAPNDPEGIINIIFRIRRKNSGYVWVDCRGKLNQDQTKSRKCVVLSGRERPVYRLLKCQLSSDLETKNEFWAKISLNGLYFFVTDTCKDVVGFTSNMLENESIYQYVDNNAITDITTALDSARNGNIVTITNKLLNLKGNYVPVWITFYPGDTYIDNRHQPSHILLQIKLQQNDHQINIKPKLPEEEDNVNLFPELETVRSTNWQYELHQLKQTNKKLKEKLELYSNANKDSRIKKRKAKKPSNVSKICSNCQATDSPEWRKGPKGPKELCNACGLRYAKSIKKR